jgi:hypothetical protein
LRVVVGAADHRTAAAIVVVFDRGIPTAATCTTVNVSGSDITADQTRDGLTASCAGSWGWHDFTARRIGGEFFQWGITDHHAR